MACNTDHYSRFHREREAQPLVMGGQAGGRQAAGRRQAGGGQAAGRRRAGGRQAAGRRRARRHGGGRTGARAGWETWLRLRLAHVRAVRCSHVPPSGEVLRGAFAVHRLGCKEHKKKGSESSETGKGKLVCGYDTWE
jgi:hypothetical protein